jgi:hypothetical protein
VLDPARPLAHLMREVAGNLLARPPGVASASQLDPLVARAVAAYVRTVGAVLPDLRGIAKALERTPEHLLEVVNPERFEWLAAQVAEWLASTRPRVWRPCLRALFSFPLPAKRALAAAWLRGEELDERELGDVGVGREDARDPEERAARTLATLAALLKYDRPLLVCFDRLEALDTPERRAAFAAQLAFVLDRMPGAVAVCSARPDIWNALCMELPAPIIARFEQNRIDLAPCSADAALELVAASAPVDEVRLPRVPLDDLVDEGALPRSVLERADRHRRAHDHPGTPPTEDPLTALGRTLRERAQALAAQPERFGPDAAQLAEALRILLTAAGPVTLDAPKGVFRRAAFVARWGHRTIGVFVDADRHWRGTGSPLNAAAAVLEAGEAAGSIYVRDGRRPACADADEGMEAVAHAGGLVVDLDRDTTLAWAALVGVRDAVRAHGLASEEHLTDWLRHKPVVAAAEVLAYVENRRR